MQRIRAASVSLFGNWVSPRHGGRPTAVSSAGGGDISTPDPSPATPHCVNIAMADLEGGKAYNSAKSMRGSLHKYLEAIQGAEHPSVSTPGGR